MVKKNQRHLAIQKLVEKELIEDQSQLVELLKKRHGIDTNQVQISRDLRSLGITKQKKSGKIVYGLPQHDTTQEMLLLSVKDVLYNESVIVVKTIGGLAAFVGDFLDLQEDTGILGTIGGENIVVIIPKSTKEIKAIYQTICKILYFKKGES